MHVMVNSDFENINKPAITPVSAVSEGDRNWENSRYHNL